MMWHMSGKNDILSHRALPRRTGSLPASLALCVLLLLLLLQLLLLCLPGQVESLGQRLHPLQDASVVSWRQRPSPARRKLVWVPAQASCRVGPAPSGTRGGLGGTRFMPLAAALPLCSRHRLSRLLLLSRRPHQRQRQQVLGSGRHWRPGHVCVSYGTAEAAASLQGGPGVLVVLQRRVPGVHLCRARAARPRPAGGSVPTALPCPTLLVLLLPSSPGLPLLLLVLLRLLLLLLELPTQGILLQVLLLLLAAAVGLQQVGLRRLLHPLRGSAAHLLLSGKHSFLFAVVAACAHMVRVASSNEWEAGEGSSIDCSRVRGRTLLYLELLEGELPASWSWPRIGITEGAIYDARELGRWAVASCSTLRPELPELSTRATN